VSAPAEAARAARDAGERRHVVCAAAELPVGARRIVEVDGRSIGVFNVHGTLHALHNGCPHKAGPLCEGPISGTTVPTEDYGVAYGCEGELVRCAWHGWEFEIATGRCVADPSVRARTYPVTVEHGQVVVTL
jgi:nitrite reductase/ring-hydroxylating ferredoxin subunit